MGTVYRRYARLRDDGTGGTINHHLVIRDRADREASPTAAVVDRQSVITTEICGVRGDDNGQKIKGRKRHTMVDTDGRALGRQAHPADVQDRDGAARLLRAARPRPPFVQLADADGGYEGPRVAKLVRVEIVRKTEGHVGFVVHARRWVVGRFFAWINGNRRLASDVVAILVLAEASRSAASAMTVQRRLGATQAGALTSRVETDSEL